MKRHRFRRWFWRIAIILLFVAILDYHLYPILVRTGGESFNHGGNGLWLRYTWYFGKWNDADLDRLSSRLNESQIRYAYFHVRSIKPDGTLKFRYPQNARRLVREIHSKSPSVKPIAWVYAGNPHGMGGVDLANPAIRRAMVNESLWLVNECGFDGVQMDYEICPSGDKGFLVLMSELGESFPRDKILSVATALWVPDPFLKIGGWSDDYFAKVAANCDQMCVMCYDSATYFPRAYVWLVRQQVIHVSRSVARANPGCRVIFGVPSYHKGVKAHNPHAETIQLALKGVREGFADDRTAKRVCGGVAIFADYTTQPDEWQAYRRLWMGNP